MFPSRIPNHRLSERRHARPLLESLEDRKLLYATLGASFDFGSRITYSFVPDGTSIGGAPSALFQAMANRGFSTSQWETAVSKAASLWEAAANVNLVQVSDDGSSFGAKGNQQGDSRFGDVRIGGTALSSSVLASCFLPPPINGGTLAGDIVINTSQSWQINSDYDLQTVAIHEFGHALGLDHSSVSTADMFANYSGQKQTITADDASGIQAVYGARQPDQYDAGSGNNTSLTATNITSQVNANAQAAIPSLDITSASDSDWFVVTAPSNASGTLTVTMQSSNLSSLSPKLLLYSGGLQGIASASAANTFGATVTTTTSGVTPGQRFFIKCLAANGGATGIGGYGLLVNFATASMSPISPPNTIVASQPDQGGGSSNDSTLAGTTVEIGSLSGDGDNLSIDARFQEAIDLVDAGHVRPGTFISPLETILVDFLAAIGHAAPNTTNGHAIRTAAIQAIDSVLAHWGN